MTEIEFSRPARVLPLPRDGLEVEIEANAAERAALARLNGLPGIERLSASFRITKWRRGVQVAGGLSARVTQTCVVSLEPFDADIDGPIDARFLPKAAMPAPSESVADEDAPVELLSAVNQLGYRAASIVGGAIALYMAARMSWPTVYLVMAARAPVMVVMMQTLLA